MYFVYYCIFYIVFLYIVCYILYILYCISRILSKLYQESREYSVGIFCKMYWVYLAVLYVMIKDIPVCSKGKKVIKLVKKLIVTCKKGILFTVGGKLQYYFFSLFLYLKKKACNKRF